MNYHREKIPNKLFGTSNTHRVTNQLIVRYHRTYSVFNKNLLLDPYTNHGPYEIVNSEWAEHIDDLEVPQE